MIYWKMLIWLLIASFGGSFSIVPINNSMKHKMMGVFCRKFSLFQIPSSLSPIPSNVWSNYGLLANLTSDITTAKYYSNNIDLGTAVELISKESFFFWGSWKRFTAGRCWSVQLSEQNCQQLKQFHFLWWVME